MCVLVHVCESTVARARILRRRCHLCSLSSETEVGESKLGGAAARALSLSSLTPPLAVPPHGSVCQQRGARVSGVPS